MSPSEFVAEKFQQKARKQTKQKKSKSAEFLMGKEERAATEGIANPAFNISSTDLSASQTSEEEIIRHDKLDSTRAAHQQKLGLQAQAEPRGEISLLIIITLSDSAYVLDLTCAFHSSVFRQTFLETLGCFSWEDKMLAENI
ncbi:UNVERIFIED_CONTAM: hypothetical protein K2H54_057585 [Gekko kuhli]